MMDYLKEYNIDDKQIKEIVSAFNSENINTDILEFEPEKVIEILDLFKDIGVNNLYEIMKYNPSLFCDTVKSVRDRINNYGDKNKLAKLINEDVHNLIEADLM